MKRLYSGTIVFLCISLPVGAMAGEMQSADSVCWIDVVGTNDRLLLPCIIEPRHERLEPQNYQGASQSAVRELLFEKTKPILKDAEQIERDKYDRSSRGRESER